MVVSPPYRVLVFQEMPYCRIAVSVSYQLSVFLSRHVPNAARKL